MERSSFSAMIIHVNLQDICEIRLHSKTRLVILNVSANSVDRKYLRMTEHHCLNFLFFRRFNRLVLTDLMPSDSYRMNLTLVGKGSPPKTKMKPFDVDLYPSVVEVTGTQELRTLLKINYRVAGNFSVSPFTDGTENVFSFSPYLI